MSQSSVKKRKSNPLEAKHTPSKKQRKQATEAPDDSYASDPSTLVSDEEVFTLECPVRKVAKKGKKDVEGDDIFGPKEEDGGFPELKIEYAIRPGKAWTDLKTFRNFSIQNEKFSMGSVVYINRHTPPPEPPDMNASEAETLAFEKENYWVGQVLEVKAANSSEVWLRVFWLYWPDELPRGRRKYHGNQELIMSNHMGIVDAKAVASKADINAWDEQDEDQDVGHRFWRQFYDVQTKERKNRGLSTLRRHCVCSEYYNPDETMLRCPNSTCGIWNHQECLEQALLEKTYERLINDQNPTKAKPKPFPVSKSAQLKSEEEANSKNQDGYKLKSPAMKSGSGKKSSKHFASLKGLIKAEVNVGEKGAGGASVSITDGRAQDPEVWTEGIQCLKCGTSID